jgi:hypothetical protein
MFPHVQCPVMPSVPAPQGSWWTVYAVMLNLLTFCSIVNSSVFCLHPLLANPSALVARSDGTHTVLHKFAGENAAVEVTYTTACDGADLQQGRPGGLQDKTRKQTPHCCDHGLLIEL